MGGVLAWLCSHTLGSRLVRRLTQGDWIRPRLACSSRLSVVEVTCHGNTSTSPRPDQSPRPPAANSTTTKMVMLSSPMLKSQSFSLPRTGLVRPPSSLSPHPALSTRASFLDRALSSHPSPDSPSPRRPHLSRRRGTSRYDPKPFIASAVEQAAGLARTRLFRLVLLPGAGLFLVVVWLSSGRAGVGGAHGMWFHVSSVSLLLSLMLMFCLYDGLEEGRRRAYARGDFGCEAKGMVSGNLTDGGRFDRQRVTVRIEPSNHQNWNKPNPADKVLSSQFHPALSAQLARDTVLFFNDSVHSGECTPCALCASCEGSLTFCLHRDFAGELAPPPAYSGKCLQPITHQLPLTLKRPPRSHEPTFHFSMCTSPARAITMAPIWSHFASAPTLPSPARHPSAVDPSPDRYAPSCLVTDAVGDNDVGAYQRADDAFAASGLRCRMRASGRTGERYEMRVLGLVADAWRESERRRWQDGDRMVEWFVFGDDDTFWVDQEDLKDLLAGRDWREDVVLGGWSEAKENFANHGKIAYGGAGIVVSRTLLRKMQPFSESMGFVLFVQARLLTCHRTRLHPTSRQVRGPVPARVWRRRPLDELRGLRPVTPARRGGHPDARDEPNGHAGRRLGLSPEWAHRPYAAPLVGLARPLPSQRRQGLDAPPRRRRARRRRAQPPQAVGL